MRVCAFMNGKCQSPMTPRIARAGLHRPRARPPARARPLTCSAGQRTVDVVSASIARFTVLSVLVLACTTVKHPPLDERSAAEMVEALKLVEPDVRHVVAVNGLLEIERGRVGPKVLDALDGFANAPADMRSMRIAAGLDSSDASQGWQQVCTASLMDTYKAYDVAAIRGACDGARLDQLGVSASAKVDPVAVVLAIITYGSIERGGPVSDAERALLAAVAAAPAYAP